jgi:hypothetical protein
VSVFQALRGNNYGAGKVLADYERELFGRGPVPVLDPLAPSVSHEMIIPADWTDYNGHTNDSRYSQLASEASDTFFRAIGFTPEYLATGRTSTPLKVIRVILTKPIRATKSRCLLASLHTTKSAFTCGLKWSVKTVSLHLPQSTFSCTLTPTPGSPRQWATR